MRRWLSRVPLTAAALVVLIASTAIAEQQPFYLTLEPPPAPELTTDQALQAFHTAPGFSIELVAAEPMVEDPVAMTWDEAGQLYVVEMRGFMPDEHGSGEDAPVGVVVRLSDTSGDGDFDTREVLLDKLVLPRALAIVNDGLLIGEPPNLWLCPTTTGRSNDIDCSAKRKLGIYGDQPGSVEHAENGLLVGLDNWLYSAKSNRRLRLHKGELLEEPTLFRGQWGIAQDNQGRLYYNTNSNLLIGDAFDARQVVAAGNKGAPGLGQPVSQNDQLFSARINPGVNRAYVPGVLRKDGRLNRPTSASGMAVYRGGQWQLAGATADTRHVFVAEPAANAVAQLRVSQQGLKMTSEHILYPHDVWPEVEFLTSTDERFRPVDVMVGPDGALYIIDMYRGIIQDHVFLTDQLRSQALARQLEHSVGRGRIWRVTADVAPPQPLPFDLGAASTEELVQLLGHSNAWHRETAQRLLLARTDRQLNRRLNKVAKAGDPLHSVHALWTLAGRDALSRRTVLGVTKRGVPMITLAAIQAGHTQLRQADLLKLVAQAADPSVKQLLLLSLADHNKHPAVLSRLVSELSATALHEYYPSAIKAAAQGQELALLQAVHEKDIWSAELEQRTGFVQALVAQGFRANPGSAGALLDFVQARSTAERWLQVAALDGLFDVSRGNKFERAVLAEEHTLFGIEQDDLWPAVARARRAVTWSGDTLAVDVKPLSPVQLQAQQQGEDYFLARCATCHGTDGLGITGLAPPLAGSTWVTEATERLARIVLQGLQGPIEVAGTTWNGVMPGHAAVPEFSDSVASGLLTYLHRSWGHTERAVNPDFVADIRKQTAERSSLWTVPELMVLPTNTHYRRYEGRYGRPGFALEFVYNGQVLEVKSGIFNGPMVNEKEDHFLFEPRALRIEFVLADSGDVIGARMVTPDGEIEMPRLAD